MKKLILVAAPPACGKTYVAELIAKTAGPMAYFDKDGLSALVRAVFAAANEPLDMDGEFYKNNIRTAEYATLFETVFSALRFEEKVIVNAPFGNEVRSVEFMRSLKERTHQNGAELILIWVTAPLSVCYERMKSRNSDRDTLKLEDWDNYVKNINYTPPLDLKTADAVDCLLIFDNQNEQTAQRSLDEVLKTIGE